MGTGDLSLLANRRNSWACTIFMTFAVVGVYLVAFYLGLFQETFKDNLYVEKLYFSDTIIAVIWFAVLGFWVILDFVAEW